VLLFTEFNAEEVIQKFEYKMKTDTVATILPLFFSNSESNNF
jgi:hypothetical protein